LGPVYHGRREGWQEGRSAHTGDCTATARIPQQKRRGGAKKSHPERKRAKLGLALVRLCGVREIIAFALAAFIGDIQRFASPKKLVKYVGLNPAFDNSGASEWSGGIGGHGHKILRSLLIEGAQAILRCSQTALARWGRKLLAAKGSVNLAVAAIARKLTVALWYLMMGRWTPLEELDARLLRKVSSMISAVGQPALKALGKTRKRYREEISQRLKSGRIYVLDPNKMYTPRPAANPA